jgi:hypothetical protein
MTITITPMQQVGDFLLKRDDLFEVAGVRGSKARSCWALAQGAPGLATASQSSSPQGNIVAHVARALGVPCRVHAPTGKLSPELAAAQAAGAVIQQHRYGYSSVIARRACDDAQSRGWRLGKRPGGAANGGPGACDGRPDAQSRGYSAQSRSAGRLGHIISGDSSRVRSGGLHRACCRRRGPGGPRQAPGQVGALGLARPMSASSERPRFSQTSACPAAGRRGTGPDL